MSRRRNHTPKINPHVTDEQVEFIRSLAADNYATEIARLFQEKYGQNRNRKGIQTICRRFGIKYKKRPNKGMFVKGMTTWNKGLKGVNGYSATRFENGHMPHTYLPVGTERWTKERHIEVKIADPNVWKRLAVINWEEEYGEFPEGYLVYHKDGNKENCDVSNLVLMTRAENVLFNKFFKDAYGHPELFEFALLTIRVWLKSNELKKNLA